MGARRLKNRILLILLAVLLLGNALSASAAEGSVGNAKIEARIQAFLQQNVVFDTSTLKDAKIRCTNYPRLVNDRDKLLIANDVMLAGVSACEADLCTYLQAFYPVYDCVRFKTALDLPWRTLAALYYTYRLDLCDVLLQHLCGAVQTEGSTLVVTIGYPDFDKLSWNGDDETKWFEAKNNYYYLNTIYADDGTPREEAGFVMPSEKVRTLCFPLDEKWYGRIKTTWLKNRDGGQRKHTGMDIRVPRGINIYACAGGVVDSVGVHVKGGYYVSIVDDDGYTYFYYHMIKNSQMVVRGERVEAGQAIGLVGNTGNSAAPHLHLSIVTPDDQFIDPFCVYYRWGYFKTGELIKKPR